MANSNLQKLLTEYELKREQSFKALEKRKKALYGVCPRLKEIESELNLVSINAGKSILAKNSPSYLKELRTKITKLKAERSQLLSSLGEKENYLKPFYECKLCSDTGYVYKNSIPQICNCLKQNLFDLMYNKINIGNLSKENFENFNIELYSNNIDKEKYNSDLSPKQNIKIVKKAALDFIESFDNPDTKNLLFTGAPGLGKTFMANAIINEMLKLGKTVLYQSAPVMFDNIINYLFSKNNADENLLHNLLTVDLLVIDDLGTETINSLKFTELYKIINTRLLNQNKITKTIISTNLSIQGLYNTYDERIVSRLIGHYNSYLFFGDDIRFKKII